MPEILIDRFKYRIGQIWENEVYAFRIVMIDDGVELEVLLPVMFGFDPDHTQRWANSYFLNWVEGAKLRPQI